MSEGINNDIAEHNFDKLSEQDQYEIIKNYLLTKKEGEKLIPQPFIAFFQKVAYETVRANQDKNNLVYTEYNMEITLPTAIPINNLEDRYLNALLYRNQSEEMNDANIETDNWFKEYQNAKANTAAQTLTQNHENQQRATETYNILTRKNGNELETFLNSINEKEQNKLLKKLDNEKKATAFIKSFPLILVDTEILDEKELDRSQYIDVFDAKNDDWLMRKTHEIIARALQNPEIVKNIVNEFPTEDKKGGVNKKTRKFILARFSAHEKEFLKKQNFNKIDIDAKIISPSEKQAEETKKEKNPPNTKAKTLEILEKKQETIKTSKFLSDEEKESLSAAITDIQEQLEQDEKNEIPTKEHRKALEAIDNQIKKLKKEFLEQKQKEKQDRYVKERKEKYDAEKQRADTIEKNNEEKKRSNNENIAITNLKPIPSAKKPVPFFYDGGQATLFIAGIASLAAAVALAILSNPLFATIAVASLAFTATAKVRQTKEQQKVDIANAANYAKANIAQYQVEHPADQPQEPTPTPLPTPYSAKIIKYAKTQKPRKALTNEIQTNLDKINKSKTTSISK